jgi:hypothetical protein
VDPVSDFHLTTKRFVTQLLDDVLKKVDPDRSEELIRSALEDYIKAAKVFTKEETYSKEKIDELFLKYVRRDGSRSFTGAQQGLHPSGDYDLTTKKYVDDLIYGYIKESDLDNFKLYVNNALNAKVKGSDVYKKSETYSRAQLEFLLQSLVNDAAKEAIAQHINDSYHLGLEDIETYLEEYARKQAKDSKYITLAMLNDILSQYKKDSEESAAAAAGMYIPHGHITSPTNVGWISPSTDLPNEMTYQDLFDLIFYDSNVEVSVDDPYVEEGTSTLVCVDIKATGITAIEYVEVWLNDGKIAEIPYSDFSADGEYKLCNVDITRTSEIKVIIYYTNGSTKEDIIEVTAVAPVYLGLLPKWLPAENLTYEILQELISDDGLINVENYNEPIYGDAANNKKIIAPVTEEGFPNQHAEFVYNGLLRRPFIMYPVATPDVPFELYEMSSSD